MNKTGLPLIVKCAGCKLDVFRSPKGRHEITKKGQRYICPKCAGEEASNGQV